VPSSCLCAGVDCFADLIPGVLRVLSQRYAAYKWDVAAVGVGALTEDYARVPRGT
jgi:hypothetical protein